MAPQKGTQVYIFKVLEEWTPQRESQVGWVVINKCIFKLQESLKACSTFQKAV